MPNIPPWINSKLFEQVLRETTPNLKEIYSFDVFPALAPGENFSSTILKVQFEISVTDNLDARLLKLYILKVPNGFEDLVVWDIFTAEKQMYHEVVPDFEQLYVATGRDIKFGARRYLLPVEENYVLLENLILRGFKTHKKQDCLDMEHCKGVLKKMAQWHAASAVRVERKGSFSPLLREGILDITATDVFERVFIDFMKSSLGAVKKLPQHEKYYNKLVDLSNNLLDVLRRNTQADEREFNVLNHGDCWSNNIMFQYDAEGRLQDTYFVDLQMTRYGSPAQDLYYFIMSSSKLELKVNRFDEMIKFYHGQLVEHLELLKYKKPMPSLGDIQQALHKYSLWGTLTATTILAGILFDPAKLLNGDSCLGSCDSSPMVKDMIFLNDTFVRHLEIVLPWLENRGGLDYEKKII